MNRLIKLFFHVYPGVLSAPTAVQYYDLAKQVVRPGLPRSTEATPVTAQKNAADHWTRTVIRLAQQPWWRKAEKPRVAA